MREAVDGVLCRGLMLRCGAHWSNELDDLRVSRFAMAAAALCILHSVPFPSLLPQTRHA